MLTEIYIDIVKSIKFVHTLGSLRVGPEDLIVTNVETLLTPVPTVGSLNPYPANVANTVSS